MRLHRLQLNAFGPFAGREEVDFDALGDAGLFLLHGPTGAGKSSLLDAVCFALYGRAPGARGAARAHLRSDHAAPDARPEVRLELTLRGRRVEVTRSPEWVRPKRRGSGTTIEKASASLREWRGGQWHAVAASAQEVGHELQDLLGMRLDQFTAVVLLPQGEFAAFLRADAEARRGLLEQLFATGRFSDVEGWLVQRRRVLGREVAAVRSRTEELLARADEHAAQLTLDAPDAGPASGPDEPPTAVRPGDSATTTGPTATERLAGLATHAARLAGEAATHAEARTQAAEAAARALVAGRDLAGRQARLATLTARAAALLADGTIQERRAEQVAAARRAAPLRAHLSALARLSEQLTRADTELELARAAVPAVLAGSGSLAWETARTELTQELGRLTDAVEMQAALAEQGALRSTARAEEQAATQAAAAARAEQRAAVARRAEAAAALELLTASAARHPAAEAALKDVERVERARRARDALRAEVDQAARAVTVLQQEAVQLKEQWLGLRERRLDGMAAELAAGLSDGVPCPVCGSAAHPAPAVAGAPAVPETSEEAAQQASFGAERALANAREHHAVLAKGLQDETDRVGGLSARELKARLLAAKAELALRLDAATRLAPLRAEIAALDGQVEQLADLADQLLTAAATRRAETAAATARLRRLQSRLDRLRGTDADVATRSVRLSDEVSALTALITAADEQRHVVQAHEQAAAECESACRAAGFTDELAAARALLPDAELTALARGAAAYDEQVATVHDQLADPDLVEAAGSTPVDLATLQHDEVVAGAARRGADQDHARLERARLALQRLAGELAEHEVGSAALLRESDLVDDLARCVEGSGGDNTLRMRLSSYVLAARLEEVAAAATERLQAMSDGRYSLVHSDALARGGVRSGLGLRVVDEWTGVERETATLSGGECFLASLALALGLADAVQAEAGGAVMQTLFVDEGFGTLDEESLEEVMGVLDSLRDGGRCVGLVSHVADLRTRIPAQLEVRKSRVGSTLVHHLDRARGAA